MSYFFWELSRRPDIMAKLQAELDHAMPDSRVIPDISVLQKLPYLNAFIKEGSFLSSFIPSHRPLTNDRSINTYIGLRIYSAAPSLLERVVPPTTSTSKNGSSSSFNNEPFDLMGYVLPPNTIVATQGWSMHRDAAIFPSPSTFLPERWLEPSSPSSSSIAHLMAMQQHFMPFGTGSRVCGGQNLAMIMLRVSVAAVARNFDVVADPRETNEKSMNIKDSFVCFTLSVLLFI